MDNLAAPAAPAPSTDAVRAPAARPASALVLRDRVASTGPATRRRRLADTTMPVSSPQAPFTLTAGAPLFSDHGPTSPQLQAFARSLERDLSERFSLVDTLYTGLRDFTVSARRPQQQGRREQKLHHPARGGLPPLAVH